MGYRGRVEANSGGPSRFGVTGPPRGALSGLWAHGTDAFDSPRYREADAIGAKRTWMGCMAWAQSVVNDPTRSLAGSKSCSAAGSPYGGVLSFGWAGAAPGSVRNDSGPTLGTGPPFIWRLLAAHAQQGGDMAMTHPLPASTACAGPLQQVENGVPIDQTRCDEFVFRHEFVWLVRHFECAGPKDNSLCTD
jgi:hypothetical protein